MVMAHAEEQPHQREDQECEEQRHENGIADQESKADCRDDREQRWKPEAAQRRKQRAADADLVEMALPESILSIRTADVALLGHGSFSNVGLVQTIPHNRRASPRPWRTSAPRA